MSEDHMFDDYIGDEDLDTEFKLFTLKGFAYDNKFASFYCNNNIFDFNQIVIHSFKKYFQKYIARYMCGFFNSAINGVLYMGVNDWGFVKGIPYNGTLPINSLIKKFYHYIKISFPHLKRKEIKEMVTIDFIEINFPEEKIPSDDINPIYTNFLQDKKEFMEKYTREKDRFNQWKDYYAFATGKLVSILNHNHTRPLIIDFIIERTGDNNHVICNLLRSSIMIQAIEPDEIAKVVKDTTNPYHWASEWKDHMCIVLKNQRPYFSRTSFQYENIPYNLISGVTDMVPFWKKFNPGLKLYIAKINYFYNPENKTKWHYIDYKTGNTRSCYRTLDEYDNPVLLPL